MATAAQIEANRRNAQMSTGPKTAAGKARASLNAMKHGPRAKAAAPVLPQEDARSWTRRSASWVEDLQPVGDPERDLVARAAKLSPQEDAGGEGETEDLHHGGHGGHGGKRTTESGMRERSQFRERTEGRAGTAQRARRARREETTDGMAGDARNEADSGSREGGIGGRAGEGRTIPGRKRITARGAVGGSEEGCEGEKKGASEANLEMIKQVMAQRFSDMPAARGAARTKPNCGRRWLS